MLITEDDAAFMYARACRAWYRLIVRRTMKQLERAQDQPGVRIWSRVADHLARLAKESSDLPQRPRHFD